MIGERLAEIRKDHGDTQKDLAEKVSVVVHTISSWEQEKSEPSHELLVWICRLYGISADYLLGISDVDPAYIRRKAEQLNKDEQILIRDFQDFLIWRRRK